MKELVWDVDWASLSYGVSNAGWEGPILHILEPVENLPGDRDEMYDYETGGYVPITTQSVCAHQMPNLPEVPHPGNEESVCTKCWRVMVAKATTQIEVEPL